MLKIIISRTGAFLILLISAFSSCNKPSSIDSQTLEIKNNQFKIIMNWLETQKTGINTEKNNRINELQNSLNHVDLSITKLKGNSSFATIKINTSNTKFISETNGSKFLVIKFDNITSVRWAMLVDFSNNSSIEPNANTFASFFEDEVVQDGKYKVSTLWGSFLYELGYLNEKVSFRKALLKKENDDASPLDKDCTAWYWVTTTYYSDGSSDTTYDYIGTTCSGCAPEMIDCPGSGSGGGNTYYIPVSKTLDWRVYTTGYWYLTSWETLGGVKTDGMGGGHFTSNVHVNEQIVNTQISGYATWQKLFVTNSYQYASADSKVVGKVTYNDGTPDVPVNKTKYWFFPDVSW